MHNLPKERRDLPSEPPRNSLVGVLRNSGPLGRNRARETLTVEDRENLSYRPIQCRAPVQALYEVQSSVAAVQTTLPILVIPGYSRSKGIWQAKRKKYTEGRKLGTREEDNLFGSGGPGGHADPGAGRPGSGCGSGG